jgi:hypothetical protein
MTSFAYPIEGSDERIIVATTRPETMFTQMTPGTPIYMARLLCILSLKAASCPSYATTT